MSDIAQRIKALQDKALSSRKSDWELIQQEAPELARLMMALNATFSTPTQKGIQAFEIELLDRIITKGQVRTGVNVRPDFVKWLGTGIKREARVHKFDKKKVKK